MPCALSVCKVCESCYKAMKVTNMNRLVWAYVLVLVAVIAANAARADEVPDVNPMSGDENAIKGGKSWFRGVCALCHGGRADGAGERGKGADLRKFNKGFKAYVMTVKNGRKVPGQTMEMPPWNGVLKDDVIYQIGAYLETLAIEGANWKEGTKNN
jgi:mono/diheme cytochrome c family protein